MPHPLPIRIAHPSHPQLSYFTDEYFEMLVRCGYGALALDASPFDSDTGRVSQFFVGWHLISFYDIAYSAQRDRLNRQCENDAFEVQVQSIAQDELGNHIDTETWTAALIASH